MSSTELNQPQYMTLFTMEILMLTVDEVSAALLRMASDTPQLSLVPHGNGVLTSCENDVVVSETFVANSVEIAEPECGQPIVRTNLDAKNPQLQKALRLIEAIEMRRKRLSIVMNELCSLHPTFPVPESSVRLADLANACDMHIATVSRALDNKTCLTSLGRFPCRNYIHGLLS